MRITNLPSDTELLDALDRLLRAKSQSLTISSDVFNKSLKFADIRVGNGSKEGTLRIAIRTFLQRRKQLPADTWDAIGPQPMGIK